MANVMRNMAKVSRKRSVMKIARKAFQSEWGVVRSVAVNLQKPLQVGALELPNRIVMAPLTRQRASEGRVPNALMAEYYGQRAGAGLILSEATCVSADGVGYDDTPGIWSQEQVEGWKLVTDAVHAKGGRIFLQLWHVGRISHSTRLEGKLPVAPSPIAAAGHVSGMRPETAFEVPRELSTEEVREVVEAFRKGAENAKAAGFDGVEIHGANGYLLDQFLQDSTNKRSDVYGGSLENRARLLLEATDAAIGVWGADRVGVHLAPRGDAHDMGDSNPSETFGYVATELDKRGVAFICTREHVADDSVNPVIRERFKGAFFANEQFTPETAEAYVSEGKADGIAFGVLYIANPDLAERIAAGAPLNEPDEGTFYGGGETGYTDYPAMGDAK